MNISCKESRIENNRSFYGCFSVGPFEAGQGLTIANALRRTLLSECTGLAIVSVKIENVYHEYSTLPGVRESVLDILLNIKEIVLKKQPNPRNTYKKKGLSSVYKQVGSPFFRPVVGYLKRKGPGVIRAKDLRLPPFIQCVDPEQYIATLAEDGCLNMKFVIMEGKGYIIQKSNISSSLRDDDSHENLVKKRKLLLKHLKEIMENAAQTEKNTRVNPTKKRNTSDLLKGSLKETRITQRTRTEGSNNFLLAEIKDIFENGRNTKEGSSTYGRHAKRLNIDAVFSPVTKVNYVIEGNDNFLVDRYHEKYSLIEDITSIIDSKNVLNTNFPRLSTVLNETSDVLSTERRINEFINYVEKISPSDFSTLTSTLHPVERETSKHHIVLEIWTNGSLHPRDALYTALKNLSITFSTLQKSQV